MSSRAPASPVLRSLPTALFGIWAALATAGSTSIAQDDDSASNWSPLRRPRWEDRLADRGNTRVLGGARNALASGSRPTLKTAQAVHGAPLPVLIDPGDPLGATLEEIPYGPPAPMPLPGGVQYGTVPDVSVGPGAAYVGFGPGYGGYGGYGMTAPPPYGPGGGYWGAPDWGQDFRQWLGAFSIFAGVHGFKNASDLGRNGNFGFQEGLNLGGSFGDPWGFGYQAGVEAVHSNFKGNQTLSALPGAPDIDGGTRNQLFATGGIFHRAVNLGLQSGVVLDYYHDSYFTSADLLQLRTEGSLALPQFGDIGFWGAFGISRDQIEARFNPQTPLNYVLAPKDMYSLFYRRHFTGGGQGRLSVGLSGDADVVLAGEISVPIGTSWALQNNFTFLIPRQGAADGGQMNESWAVGIQLVWYPGQSALEVHRSPYFPLFNVADNSVFLINRR